MKDSDRPKLEEREGRWRAWMLAAQSGDSASYEKLLHELLPFVQAFVSRRLFDQAAEEDVVQNVLLSLHRARHTYRGERPFSPWLSAIARNAVIDSIRARGRRREVSLETPGVSEPAVQAELPMESRMSPELEAALAALSASQREAVLMIHLEELSVAEAALRTGASQGAIRVRAHRGYKNLRARLEKSGW